MKLLPPPGRERTRLFVLLGALVILGVAYTYQQRQGAPSGQQAARAPAASNLTVPATSPAASSSPSGVPGAPSAGSGQTPQPLKLAQIEQVPDEPSAGRNLFRFGVKPVPPPPTPVNLPPPPQQPPPPSGPPPIPLKLRGLMDDPYGAKRCYLLDPSGAVFEATEGQEVDGRYKVVRVGTNSVVVAYLDGTGQRTLMIGG